MRKNAYYNSILQQWFPPFLMLQPFTTVPYGEVTPEQEIILFLLHIYICYCCELEYKCLICESCEKVNGPPNTIEKHHILVFL